MSLANGSAASLNGAPGNYSLVSIQQTGLVTITFFVSENSSENYKAATVTLVVDVVKVNQNISLNTAPPNFLSFSENLSFTIDASSSSSLPLSYNILSGNGLINSNIVSVTGVGQIIIQLSQQGNNEFNPAPLSNLTVNVGQGNTFSLNLIFPKNLLMILPLILLHQIQIGLVKLFILAQTHKLLLYLEPKLQF